MKNNKDDTLIAKLVAALVGHIVMQQQLIMSQLPARFHHKALFRAS